jgi:hypothetical protein
MNIDRPVVASSPNASNGTRGLTLLALPFIAISDHRIILTCLYIVRSYCSCFRACYYCSENCQCQDCMNTEARCTLVEERVDLILEKNPHAFDPKIAVVQEATQIPAVVQEEKQVFVQSYSAAPVWVTDLSSISTQSN